MLGVMPLMRPACPEPTRRLEGEGTREGLPHLMGRSDDPVEQVLPPHLSDEGGTSPADAVMVCVKTGKWPRGELDLCSAFLSVQLCPPQIHVLKPEPPLPPHVTFFRNRVTMGFDGSR